MPAPRSKKQSMDSAPLERRPAPEAPLADGDANGAAATRRPANGHARRLVQHHFARRLEHVERCGGGQRHVERGDRASGRREANAGARRPKRGLPCGVGIAPVRVRNHRRDGCTVGLHGDRTGLERPRAGTGGARADDALAHRRGVAGNAGPGSVVRPERGGDRCERRRPGPEARDGRRHETTRGRRADNRGGARLDRIGGGARGAARDDEGGNERDHEEGKFGRHGRPERSERGARFPRSARGVRGLARGGRARWAGRRRRRARPASGRARPARASPSRGGRRAA